MLFSTPQFVGFFSIYLLAHFTIPIRYRNYLIILGSTIFYTWWKIEFVWLPYLLILIASLGVFWIDKTEDKGSRRHRMLFVILVLFVPLIFYKYTNFIISIFQNTTSRQSDGLLNLALPLGISFVTFTLTAYVIDVANKKFEVVRNPGTLIAYILFYPHLIAGPILRQNELVPQLQKPHAASFAHFKSALAIFTVGLVKKLVFADQIGAAVDSVYLSQQPLEGFTATLAIVGFAAQIFCDFSGYTDMAIGIARMIGIALPNNFARPYTALSFSDLWRRWHITLTKFLLDYIYTPLALAAARRQMVHRWSKWLSFLITVAIPINITFLVSGIWHGAGWNFVLFGLFTGLAMSINFAWRSWRKVKLPKQIAWFLTITTFVLSLILFRSHTLSIASNVLSAPFTQHWELTGANLVKNILPILLIAVFALTHRYDEHRRIIAVSRSSRPTFFWVSIAFAWVLSALISQGSSASFVYFDF